MEGAPRYFASPLAFRKWLEKNHASKDELLVGFRKVATGRPSLTWAQSVDEALAYGWIDGVRKRIDDEAYTIRFTPRRNGHAQAETRDPDRPLRERRARDLSSALTERARVGAHRFLESSMKLVLAACLASTTALLPVFAQPPAPGSPMAPYENLAFFEGKWTVEGDDREYRETCTWMPEGRRHMICRARWKSSTGPRESMSIFSHEQGVGYVRYGMNPMGRVDRMRGRLDGERWLWSGEGGAEAKTTRIRASVTPEGKGGFRFTEETSQDGGPWKQSADVRYLRLP